MGSDLPRSIGDAKRAINGGLQTVWGKPQRTQHDLSCVDLNPNTERTHETDHDRNAGAVYGLCIRRLRRRQKSTERNDVVPNALRLSATASIRLAERTGHIDVK